MKRISLYLILLTIALACARTGNVNTTDIRQNAKTETAKPRRLEVLFLGDDGPHKPIEFVPVLMEAMGSKGINFTYTDRSTDLNPQTLGKYDALLLYADSVALSPA